MWQKEMKPFHDNSNEEWSKILLGTSNFLKKVWRKGILFEIDLLIEVLMAWGLWQADQEVDRICPKRLLEERGTAGGII